MAHYDITDTEFFERFRPITNHISPEDGELFETYGEDLAYILSLANSENEEDRRRVWTVMDGDSGEWCVGDGYHLVNRLNYYVTEVPCPLGDTFCVTDPSEPERDEEGNYIN